MAGRSESINDAGFAHDPDVEDTPAYPEAIETRTVPTLPASPRTLTVFPPRCRASGPGGLCVFFTFFSDATRNPPPQPKLVGISLHRLFRKPYTPCDTAV